ncbi:MAG: MBL fold metallo-hydrolase [Lachnospiraceae bacterium]|nr:MBL fold metallo-hydrolase [Lachnospiraceae bacterium]
MADENKPLKIGKMVVGEMQTNSFFVYREGESKVIFFDPASQGKYICDKLKENGFEVEVILLTHGHFDHIGGVDALREASGAKVYAMEAEKVLLEDAYVNVSAQMHRPVTVTADGFFNDGDILEYGDKKCRVIGTPGHTIGSCCFYFEEAGILIGGDTLFAESYGRTDFPTGKLSSLRESVEKKLFVLPDDTKVYPGHGPATTIGHEKEFNPLF